MDNIKIKNINIYDDILTAKKIVSGKLHPEPYVFGRDSSIYLSTNEDVSHEIYIDSLKNRKRVLSIIGSGDQILNSILVGAEEIVGIDISRFPKYFLPLKISAVKNLSKNEYLEYFFGKSPLDVKYYNKIRSCLDDDSRTFWDQLYKDFDSNLIYNSQIFSNFRLDGNKVVNLNPYLKDENYKKLKNKVEFVDVFLQEHNMFDIKSLNAGKFDLIILSNIINYIGQFCKNNHNDTDEDENVKAYKKFLKQLPLNRNGIALSYNLILNGEIKNKYKEKEYQVENVQEDLKSTSIKNEILIYKKKKLF